MQSLKQSDQLWTEVQETCESLSSDIYLPTDVESHLERAPVEHHHYQSYPPKLREALNSVENLFGPGDEGHNVDESFVKLDNYLKTIEDKLQSIVSSLEQSSSAVRDSADSFAITKDQVIHVSDAAKHISDFVDALRLPDDVHSIVTHSNPHSDEFKSALTVISRVLSTCDTQRDAPAVQEVLPSATSVRDLVIRRIGERLRGSFELMKEPSSSFTILRDTLLLQHRPLIEFLKDHGRASFEWLTEEYVNVAKLAFGFQARSYYDKLSRCGSTDPKTTVNTSFVGRNATKLLSSLWDYSSSVSRSEEERYEAGRSEGLEHTESLEQLKEGLSLLSDECEDILRSALSPPMTTAELELMRNPSALSFTAIFRQLISFFLKYEKTESRFLTELFGDEGGAFLAKIFSRKGNPLLECLERSCQSLETTLEVEQLCLSLYVCRYIRENIKTHEDLDHRIAFCVIAERVIQTRFASCLDSKAALARELQEKLLLKEIEPETTNTKSQSDITWFSVSIARLLEIVRHGDKWISSQDMGYALRRRLLSSVGSVISLLDIMNATNTINEHGIKSSMRFSARFSFAIDTCASLQKEKDRGTEEIRKEVQDRFRGLCEAYANIFEDSRLRVLSQLENSSATTTFEECSQLLSVLREKHKDIQNLVREDMMFLQNDPIGVVYEDEAVRHILNSFQRRTEAVKLKISSYHPELS